MYYGTIQFTEQLTTTHYFQDITHTTNILHLTTWILLDFMLTDHHTTIHFHQHTLMFQPIFQDHTTTATFQNHITPTSQDLTSMITQASIVQDTILITDIKITAEWLNMIATI